ncbi:MAG: hypothetical protein ABIK93_06835 [candidate division WOR-3 bacterium]
MRTFLNLLRVCSASWIAFLRKLDRIDFRQRYEKLMAQLTIPPTKRKIEQDVMHYKVGVEMPSKEK